MRCSVKSAISYLLDFVLVSFIYSFIMILYPGSQITLKNMRSMKKKYSVFLSPSLSLISLSPSLFIYLIFIYISIQFGTRISCICDSDDIATRSQQPQLVCIGNLTREAHQFVIFVKNDKVVIPLEDESLTCALDKLFKFFWVYNFSYPPQLTSVFTFFEYVYDLPMSKTVRRSKALELISKLQALD